jgi:hypothetical protein
MLLLVAALAASGCAAQEQVNSVVFASPDKHVVLPRGLMVTLKTVAPTKAAGTSSPSPPAGLFLETTLDQKLDGKHCKLGDPVRLVLSYPIQFESNGQPVRIPERASVTGHVVLVTARGGQEEKSRLAFVTDRISWPGGTAELVGIAVAAKEDTAETAKQNAAPDLVRPAQDAAGNAHEGRGRGHDSSGGQNAPGNAHDMGR